MIRNIGYSLKDIKLKIRDGNLFLEDVVLKPKHAGVIANISNALTLLDDIRCLDKLPDGRINTGYDEIRIPEKDFYHLWFFIIGRNGHITCRIDSDDGETYTCGLNVIHKEEPILKELEYILGGENNG